LCLRRYVNHYNSPNPRRRSGCVRRPRTCLVLYSEEVPKEATDNEEQVNRGTFALSSLHMTLKQTQQKVTLHVWSIFVRVPLETVSSCSVWLCNIYSSCSVWVCNVSPSSVCNISFSFFPYMMWLALYKPLVGCPSRQFFGLPFFLIKTVKTIQLVLEFISFFIDRHAIYAPKYIESEKQNVKKNVFLLTNIG
jgi:hypothetical protein